VALDDDPERLVVTHPDLPCVAAHDLTTGDRWVVRLQVARRPVDAGLLAAAREEALGDLSFGAGERTAAYEQVLHPDSAMAYRRVEWDPAGRLWLGRFAGPRSAVTEWHVVTLDGEWLGEVSTALPDRVAHLMAVRGDQVALEWRDDRGVPHIGLHRVRW
jgi:hypothetical protein